MFRIKLLLEYTVGTQHTVPGLRFVIFVNDKEVICDAIPWLEFIRARTVKRTVKLESGPNKQRLRRIATKQEKTVAEALGGQRQTGSGARPGHKGDGRVFGLFRIENKFTTKQSFSIKLRDLLKIRAECAGQEVPIFDVQFKEEGTLKTKEHWAFVPWGFLERTHKNAQTSDDS